MRTIVPAVTALTALLVSGAAFGVERELPAPISTQDLETVLAGFDGAQMRTDTLIAAFQETKKVQMLADAVVSTGYFYYSRPHRVKWEYRSPESKVYLLTEDSYLAYYPEQKRAERVNIQQYSAKLFRVFGIGQTADELKKYYDIRLDASPGREGTYLLVLAPRKRRIQKRIETLRIWVNRESFLPVQMEYVEPDGDSTLLSFDRILVNPEIQASRYQIHLPRDVQVTDSFSGIGGLGQ